MHDEVRRVLVVRRRRRAQEEPAAVLDRLDLDAVAVARGRRLLAARGDAVFGAWGGYLTGYDRHADGWRTARLADACSAALQIDSSDTRALYRRYSSALPTYISCTSSAFSLIGARLAWRRGLAHNRLKKFDRAKSDLKRACVFAPAI